MSSGGAPTLAGTTMFIMCTQSVKLKHNGIWGWGIYDLNGWDIHDLNGWGIYGLNGWGIYGLNGWHIYGSNGWGSYSKVSYCFCEICYSYSTGARDLWQ